MSADTTGGAFAVEAQLVRPSQVSVNLPPDWIVLPIDELEDFPIDAVLDAANIPSDERPSVELALTELRGMIRDAPVVFSAFYALFDEDQGLVLLINLAILLDAFPADDVPATEMLIALQEDDDTTLREPELVSLPIGATLRAVQLGPPDAADLEEGDEQQKAALASLPDGPYGPDDEFTVVYNTPLAGRDHLSVASFTSPNVQHKDMLISLYDDIMSTVRYRWPAPPRPTA